MTIAFYSVKILSIIIVSAIYFICGTALSIFLDKIISDKDPKKSSTLRLIIEIAGIFGLIGIAIFYKKSQ